MQADSAAATGKSGTTCGVQASCDHTLSGAAFVRLLGGIERLSAEQVDLGYRSANLGCGITYQFANGISIYGQLLYTRRLYDAGRSRFGSLVFPLPLRCACRGRGEVGHTRSPCPHEATGFTHVGCRGRVSRDLAEQELGQISGVFVTAAEAAVHDKLQPHGV